MLTNTVPTAEEITRLFRQLEQADATAALGLAEELLSTTGDSAPALIEGTRTSPIAPGGVVKFLTCPHCGNEPASLIAVDYSVRESRASMSEASFEDRHVAFYCDGGDFEGVTLKAGCCERVVRLPEGWEQD